MTRIGDFFGVPQPPLHPKREWMIENQGITFEEDPTINQANKTKEMYPQANMVNQGVGVKPYSRTPRSWATNTKGETTKGINGE